MTTAASDFLTFTVEDAEEVFGELKELHVDLDADPLAYGPKRLNNKMAECRGVMHRVERIFLRVSKKLHGVTRAKRRAELDIELAKMQLLAEDPHVRAGRSVADRDAEASMKLRDEILAFDELTEISLAQTMAVVKAKRADLKSTVSMLKDQIRLCNEEIGLGAQWGSKKVSAPDFKPVDATAELADIDGMLGDMEGEIPLRVLGSDDEDAEGAEVEVPVPVEDEDAVEDLADVIATVGGLTEEPEPVAPVVVQPVPEAPTPPVEPTVEEAPKDAPVEPEDESGGLVEPEEAPSAAEALPDNTPADLAESFLDAMPEDAVSDPSFKDPLTGKTADDLLDVDSILDSFEDID
jgi:hypothetical protein